MVPLKRSFQLTRIIAPYIIYIHRQRSKLPIIILFNVKHNTNTQILVMCYDDCILHPVCYVGTCMHACVVINVYNKYNVMYVPAVLSAPKHKASIFNAGHTVVVIVL